MQAGKSGNFSKKHTLRLLCHVALESNQTIWLEVFNNLDLK